MRTVWKYVVPVDDQWHPVAAGKVVHVDWLYHDAVSMWIEVEVDAGTPVLLNGVRPARVYGTGHSIPTDTEHLGTAVMPGGGRLVWHVYGGPNA